MQGPGRKPRHATSEGPISTASDVTAADRRADPARLFWRFYGGLIGVVVVLVIVLAWMVAGREQAEGLADIRLDLRRTAHLAAELAAPALASGDVAGIARVIEVARAQGIRLTVMGADRRVLADSSRDPAGMNSRAERPEILEALRTGTGESERARSRTGDHAVYYAVAVVRDGALRGFVRTSASDEDIAARRVRLLRILALGSFALIAAALGVGFLFMRRFGRQFRGEFNLLLERDVLYEQLKANEGALHANEERLNEAQQIGHMGSWTWDLSSNALTWSAELYRMFGLEPDTIAPTFEIYMSFVHPDDRTLINTTLQASLRTREPFEYDHRIVLRDGTIRMVHSLGEVVTDGSGAPAMMRGTAQDITERAAADEARRQSEERFQLAMCATNDALWDWVPGTSAIWWNEGFYTMFGLARADVPLTRDAWTALIHPDDRDAVVASIGHFLKSEDTIFTCEYRLRRGDGVYAWVYDRGYVVRGPDGQPLRMIGSMMDITSRKEAERMKSDFVSFVSHQLRTPLSGMNWMLELATDAAGLPEDARGYIAEARESAGRLGGLVNDLLDVSRLESGKIALTLEPVQLDALTRSVLDEARALVAEKGHRITLESADPAATIFVDPQLMRQVITNLVSNAIKYTPPGGTIVVALACEDGRQRWTVTDSGIGIPKAAQGRLFEKFFRADNAVTMATEGTGLGLHLVRLIVEQFGGTIWCDSEEGRGATFGFALPVAECAFPLLIGTDAT